MSYPDPNGSLSKKIPSSAITSANVEVKKVVDSKNCGRGPYTKLSANVKAELGKHAAENGVAATLRRYLKDYPSLKESSVRTWRDRYNEQLTRRKQE